ncbi:MAG: cytochrome c biogenesis protein CcdA [Chloroflexota bacterium]
MPVDVAGLSPASALFAIVAGVLSFVSPCVLPLLPAYLGYMTGLSAEEMARPSDASTRIRVLGRSAAFVAGLALVFTLLGASASAIGNVLLEHQTALLRVAGLLVVIFGLHTLGLIRIPLLYRDTRTGLGMGRGGYVGALLMGAAFAAGWTPCVGPFLASILALASQERTVGQGMLLLFLYALGLGLPFVAAGLALRRALALMTALRARMRALELASGFLLVAMGLLIFSDRLSLISAWLTGVFGTGLAA